LKFFNRNKFKSIDIEPDDVILNVVELILDGRRKVDLTSYETFWNSFYYILKNSLTDIFCRKKNKYNGLKGSFNSEDDEDYDYMGEFPSNTNIFDEYERKEKIENIRKILKPYNVELEVFELMLKGYKRDEIAKNLNISPSEVTNIRKRIIRRLKPISKSIIN
jgi:RNA polymerase sigma factor (sigma-70 family)